MAGGTVNRAGEPQYAAPSTVIALPFAFILGGLGLAVLWGALPTYHTVLALLVLVLMFGLYVREGSEIASQFKSILGWSGHAK